MIEKVHLAAPSGDAPAAGAHADAAPKFTPGPWAWSGSRFLDGKDGATVLECGDDGRDWGLHGAVLRGASDYAEDAANRSLIAAAPDLYAALSYAVDNPEFDSATFDSMARTALAKARGE